MKLKFKANKPLLQVALDVVRVEDAVKIGGEALEGGFEILEAGTPLIKSEGLRAVKILKREFPEIPVVADLKTIDTGRLEVSLAAEAGADIVTVLALAPDSTIQEALEAGREYGVMVEFDLIGHPNPLDRVLQLRMFGAEIVCVHVGVDVQARVGVKAGDLKGLVGRVKEAFKGRVAVAGGVDSSSAPKLAIAGADIIIVGSAIVKSEDPKRAAWEIRDSIDKVLL